MMRPTFPHTLALGAALLLGGCAGQPPTRTADAAARPAVSPASGSGGNNGRFVSDQGMNAINRDYYLGADPMYPRGSSSGSYGHNPGGG